MRKLYHTSYHKLLFIGMTLVLMMGCGGISKKEASEDAERLMNEASRKKDFHRLAFLADSLGKADVLSEGESYYWQGFAYYHLMQMRTAEFYWQEAITATEKSTDEADLATYAKSASYLAGLFVRYLDFSNAQKVVKPVLEHLEQQQYTAAADYANLLIFAGCCQVYFDMPDDEVCRLFERAYKLHSDNINNDHTKESYRNAVVGFVNVAYCWIGEKQYGRGLVWSERLGRLIDDYRQQFPDDKAYIDKQWARYQIYSAVSLEGIGKTGKAAEVFATYQQTPFAQTPEGQIDASDYHAISGRWKEVAHLLTNLDILLESKQAGFSLEDIQKYLLKKYRANVLAGLRDSASTVANQICEHLDSAIIKSQRVDVEEQETIRQKEEQILLQQKRLSRARITGLVAAIVFLSITFTVFTIIRHRAAKRLAEVRAAKERMESELRIARDIQMSMVPSHFPDYEGLDMYASMTPAKEVGGDLYSYVIIDQWLYFCIGDVSGKGVPASLFMAQAIRLFHTLASQDMTPAEIATRMNNELTADNEQGMFVTMFIGRLNLKLYRLEYCNAGHNQPIIGNADGQFSFLEVEPNAPIGLWEGLQFEGEYIDFFKNRQLLLYTDGLNEAENRQQQQFGEDRIIEILTPLSSSKARDIIEALETAVNRFRDNAEANDDLTMLCMKLINE